MTFAPRTRALLSTAFLVLAAVAVAGIAESASAQAAAPAAQKEVTDAYRKTMRRYLEVQGSSVAIGQSVAYSAANEVMMMIANGGGEVTQQIQAIVLEEALKVYAEKFSDLDYLAKIWAPVYVNHFSEAELEEMIAFFVSPVGKKSQQLMPTINEESMASIQNASLGVAPGFQLAVDARFREAGLVSDAPPQ